MNKNHLITLLITLILTQVSSAQLFDKTEVFTKKDSSAEHFYLNGPVLTLPIIT